MKLYLIALVALVLPADAFAQDAAPPAPAPMAPPAAPKPATVQVVLTTSLGPITLEIEKERAPITAANFLKYVDQKRLDGATFYRATKVQDNFGLVQFGVRNDPKRVLPPIAHEPTTTTGLTHGDGTISMARAKPGTASGDFFITLGEQKAMDADPSQPGDNLGFAAFGHVVGGMDIIHQILDAPTSPTLGEGVMRGQMLAPQIKILSARRAG